MTTHRDDHDRNVRDAITSAARALPADDPRAHVFFEERTDLRMTLTSAGGRDVVTNRTRGVTTAGRRATHVTHPERQDLPGAVSIVPFQHWGSAGDEHEKWVRTLEATIAGIGSSATTGRRQPFWTANLVTFHQEVWVGRAQAEPRRDVRRGARVELRVRVGSARPARAVEDVLIPPNQAPDLASAFERAFERAERRASSGPAPRPGYATAIFAPGVAGIVAHELIGHALEGDILARGGTWVRAPEIRSSAGLRVIDDPRRGRGAWRIDDEGTDADETVLVDRGRTVGALLDRASAVALRAKSTGHGRRSSYLDPVRPRMGCTFIERGDEDPDEVLRSTPSGVYIRRLTGGHANPFSGRASFIVSDSDRVVDGRLAEPLEGFVLELEGSESWRSIDRVCHDLAFDTCVGSCVREGQPIAVSVGAPTIRIGVVGLRS